MQHRGTTKRGLIIVFAHLESVGLSKVDHIVLTTLKWLALDLESSSLTINVRWDWKLRTRVTRRVWLTINPIGHASSLNLTAQGTQLVRYYFGD
jgi:hypothetical protein